MEKKYELTNETIEFKGRTLHRIKALKDVTSSCVDITKGDLGGFVQSENNLSHEGGCWIDVDAKVYDKAQVYGDVFINGEAEVYDEAQVYEDAYIDDNVKICGNAKVYGIVSIHDNAKVYGEAKIYERAKIYGEAKVYGEAKIRGMSKVYGESQVYGESEVYGEAKIHGKSKVYDWAQVCGRAEISGKAQIYGEAVITDYAKINDDVEIFGDVAVYDSSMIFGDAKISGDLEIFGKSRLNKTIYSNKDYITIGPIICENNGVVTFLTFAYNRDEDIIYAYDYFNFKINGDLDTFEKLVIKFYGKDIFNKYFKLVIEFVKFKFKYNNYEIVCKGNKEE